MNNPRAESAHKKPPGGNGGEWQKAQADDASTSTKAQRARLLAALIKPQGITTVQARTELNIMHPAARVMELRAEGHRIEKIPATLFDGRGRKHSVVARYFLLELAGGDE